MGLDEKVGIDKTKEGLKLLGKGIDIGIEIGKGGINKEDLQYAPAVMAHIKAIVAFIASNPEIVKEIQDIDLVEGYELLMLGITQAKEIAEPGIAE